MVNRGRAEGKHLKAAVHEAVEQRTGSSDSRTEQPAARSTSPRRPSQLDPMRLCQHAARVALFVCDSSVPGADRREALVATLALAHPPQARALWHPSCQGHQPPGPMACEPAWGSPSPAPAGHSNCYGGGRARRAQDPGPSEHPVGEVKANSSSRPSASWPRLSQVPDISPIAPRAQQHMQASPLVPQCPNPGGAGAVFAAFIGGTAALCAPLAPAASAGSTPGRRLPAHHQRAGCPLVEAWGRPCTIVEKLILRIENSTASQLANAGANSVPAAGGGPRAAVGALGFHDCGDATRHGLTRLLI